MLDVLASETELIARAQSGDRNAFSDLVRIHTQGVLNVVYRMCGDVQMAEDAAQEAFIRAWLELGSFRPRASLRNWLYRIAVNTAIDMWRKQRHILPGALEDLQVMDSGLGPEAALAKRERTAAVQKAILSLPEASRAVLVLREYEGLSYQEIADALELPIGTVMSRLNSARNLLKGKLQTQSLLLAEVENV